MFKKVRNKAQDVSEVLSVLSNVNRLLVVCYIWYNKKSVTEISKELAISQSLVSQILSKLKSEDLVESNRMGKEVIYRIKDKKILKLIKSLKEIYC